MHKINIFVEHENQIYFNLLSSRYRLLLYFNWVRLFIKRQYTIPKNIEVITDQYTESVKKFKSNEHFELVENIYVIGMTTTAAAKNRDFLNQLKCPFGKSNLCYGLLFML